MNRCTLLFVLLLVPLLAPADMWACSIPVFRYALERWELGRYDALLFHRGPLSASDKALARSLETPSTKVNLTLTTVDLDGKVEPGVQKLWESFAKSESLPFLVVRAADSKQSASAVPIWSGPLASPDVSKLIASPARQQLVRRLAGGDCAVFLFLESGAAKADAAALQVLERELAVLEKKVQLPEPTPDGPQLRYPLPLRVGFSIVNISRTDADEGAFVHMLLRSEEGLIGSKEPIVFPVIGRGRLVCSMQASELKAENLISVVKFMCGECSCQVKELNPGVDLVIAADWTEILESSHLTVALADRLTLPLVATLENLAAVPAALGRLKHAVSSTAAALPIEPKGSSSAATMSPPSAAPPAVVTSPTLASSVEVAHDAEEVEPVSSWRVWLWSGAAAALVLMIVAGLWLGREMSGES